MFTVSYDSLPKLNATLDKVTKLIDSDLLPKAALAYNEQYKLYLQAMDDEDIPKLISLVNKRNSRSFLYLLQSQTIDDLIDHLTDRLRFRKHKVIVTDQGCTVEWFDVDYVRAVKEYRKLKADLTTFNSMNSKVNRFIALTHGEGITQSSVSFSNNNALKLNEYLEG